MPNARIIRLLAFLGALWAGGAVSQAPVEDRRTANSNSVTDGQQRLGFLRRELDAARDKVKQVELEVNEARLRQDAAQKEFDALRRQREAAGRALEGAKRQASNAQKAYDAEAAEFEKAVRDNAKDARKSSTKK